MLEQAFTNLRMGQVFIALAIIVVFSVLSFLVRLFLVKVVKKLTKKSKNHLDDILLSAAQKPLVIAVVLLGLYLSALSLPQQYEFWSYLTKILAIIVSLLTIFLVASLLNAGISWYRQDVAYKNKNVGFSLRLLYFCWIIVVLLSFWLAVIAVLGIWGLDVGKATEWLGVHGWRIALIVGIAMLLIISMGEIVPRIVAGAMSRRPDENEIEVKKRSDTLSKVLVSVSQVFIFFIGVFMILSELDIPITPILTSAGVVGVALGFGAQSLVKDVLAGLFIVIESQYRVGDVVKVADVQGVVESVNLRRTVLRDIDGIVHVVPNGEIRVASNFTKELSRVNLDVRVSYNEDLDRVMSIINKVGNKLAEDPKWKPAITKAPQALRVNNFSESAIEIKITGETLPMRQWEVTGELRLRLKKAFDKEKIEIPWPHTRMYFGDSPLRIEYDGHDKEKKDSCAGPSKE